MHQLMALTRNIRHTLEEDGTLKPMIEAILTVHDREYQLIGPEVKSVLVPKTIRFEMDIEEAELLVQNVQQWITDAKAEQTSIDGERK